MPAVVVSTRINDDVVPLNGSNVDAAVVAAVMSFEVVFGADDVNVGASMNFS